jgi:hypothetical protein
VTFDPLGVCRSPIFVDLPLGHDAHMEPTVLLVASSPHERARLGAWLEEGDFTVVTCPGPRGEVPCLGMRGHCPLAEGADAVVLEALGTDRPSRRRTVEVLEAYRGIGLGVVVLGGPTDLRPVRGRPGVLPLLRPAAYPALVAAVRRALGSRHGAERREGSKG